EHRGQPYLSDFLYRRCSRSLPAQALRAGCALKWSGRCSDFGATGYSFANGRKLFGTGTVNGKINIASGGGEVAPGNSPGVLTAQDMDWGGAGVYTWEFNDASDTNNAAAGTN